MGQTKSSYERKIQELHSKVEEKARELQAVSERVELEKAREVGVKDHITKLNNDLASIRQVLVKEAKLITSDRKRWQDEAAEHDKKLFNARRLVGVLESKIGDLKKRAEVLAQSYNDKAKLEKRIEGLQKDIKGLEVRKNKLSNQAEESKKDLESNQKAKTDLKTLAGTLVEEILEMHRVTQEYRNHIYFYIRRIVRWYKEQGRKAPDVFDRFKVNVPIREDILVKLKKEKTRKNRYV